MSFFKRLFGSANPKQASTTPNSPLTEVEVMPGLILPQAFAEHWTEIKRTERECIAISAKTSENLTFADSKLGHYPCIPKGFTYPLDQHGHYMYPLAQINCSELPAQSMLPSTGFLQFYIGTHNDVYGMSFEDDIPSDFKVLYFSADEVAEYETNLTFLDEVLTANNSPVFEPHKLSFQLKNEFLGRSDYEGRLTTKFDWADIIQQYPAHEEELEQCAFDTFNGSGHKLGGYAYFTQTDPREYKPSVSAYRLLFQLDSDKQIMWGDAGVGNFFIHPDDLAKRDFSKVFYTWDCC
ncbi:uncharacterized protein YwqG [Chitinophaga skermanii]|uniref:Uncharacterized protein YwqG n=1 Tax=Chitinophaga skermanii TaxID=331697 RepID=A0A327R359_9BACT|nr:YwqG family protein [Chitinophaga skermanii]RAJ11081.1 uncharacterized protein YwqG [Chitinophaga skermanii]